jgi:type IV secretion system protein VirD4
MHPPLLLGKPSQPRADGRDADADPGSAGGPATIREQVGPAHVRTLPGLADAVVSADDSHLMTIAPTGAGKGRDVIIPNLLSYEGSVVVFDPKGENYDVTHRYRRDELGHQIVVLDPFGASHAAAADRACLNPFDV